MRAVAVALGVLALAGCGGGEREPGGDPFAAIDDAAKAPTAPRKAAPRWERVEVLAGRGPSSARFAVAPRAIQWRARWRCAGGRLALSAGGLRAVRGECPDRGVRSAITTGPQRLRVAATGAWRVVVEQQVDTALREPPLPAGAQPVARGAVYPLERKSRGRASLARLPSGRLALRLDGFATSANTDLVIWLSPAPGPRTSRAAVRAPHTVLAPLKSTLGDQTYLLPRGTRPARVRSVVIWCPPVRIAYAAASLRPA